MSTRGSRTPAPVLARAPVRTSTARTVAADQDTAAGLELIAKVDAVISVLDRRGEMTAADLAAGLGEPLSSTYRLLQSLIGVGWVDRSPRRGHYRLGLPMMTIGSLVEDGLDIREVARPALELLLRETGSTSFLCVRRGSRAVCVDRLEGQAVRSLAMQLGGSLPLHAGAAPLALLAHLPAAERELVLRQGPELPGDPAPPAAAALERTLGEVRSRGYAVSDGDVTPGIAALGAPVFNHRHELVASISVSGLRAQVLGSRLKRNSGVLLRAASSVSAALGDEASR